MHRFKNMQWISTYREFILSLFQGSSLKDGPLGVIAVLSPLLLVFGILQTLDVYTDMALGIPGIILNVMVLVYCLRFYNIDNAIDVLSDPDINNPENRLREDVALSELLGDKVSEKLNQGKDRNTVITHEIFIQANERMFAVLFWFVVLGPLGALMYRMTWHLMHKPMQENPDFSNNDTFDGTVYRLYGILSWIPARITAVGYALAGGFDDVIHNWKEVKNTNDISRQNEEVLAQSGAGAIRIERYETEVEYEDRHIESTTVEAMQAARALVIRTLLVWLTIMAIVTLTGWVSN
jgi:membrane protein required for beta-lactamase induction